MIPASSLVPELFLTKAKVILFWQHKCEEIYQWLDKKVFWRGLHYRPFKFSGLRRISVDGNRGMGGTINHTQPVKIQNNHWKSNKESRKCCPSSRCRVIVSSRRQFWKCKRYFKFGLRDVLFVIIYWITSGLKTSVCAYRFGGDKIYLHLLTSYPPLVILYLLL